MIPLFELHFFMFEYCVNQRFLNFFRYDGYDKRTVLNILRFVLAILPGKSDPKFKPLSTYRRNLDLGLSFFNLNLHSFLEGYNTGFLSSCTLLDAAAFICFMLTSINIVQCN